MTVFQDQTAARDYLLMAASTFLVFLSHSTMAYLSVILRDLGVGEAGIGVVLSAPLVPILAGMFLSGHLMERFGPIRVVRSGLVLVLVAHLSIQFTVTDFAGVYLSRALHGFGYGIFMPAAMVYVKGRLNPERMVYPFGMYASTILLPNIVGPWLVENLYIARGLAHLFVITAVPAILGNILVQLPSVGVKQPPGEIHAGYLELLARPGLRAPYLAVYAVGMVYGIVPTLMALFLRQHAIPVVAYFTPFTAALFTGRFVVIRLLDRFPRRTLVTAGFVLMGASHLLLLFQRSPAAAAVAGVILGTGYSLEYPSLSVWIAEQFSPTDRSKPVALFNMIFHTGIFVTPLIGGWVMERFSLAAYLTALVAMAAGAAVAVGAGAGRRGRGE